MQTMVYKPDPVSVTFEGTAEQLYERARAKPGEWITVRLKDPTMRERTRWLELGVNVMAPDPVPGQKCKTTWARALNRALYRHHKKIKGSGGLKIEVGRHIPASPQFDPRYPERGGFPPSRQFRVRIEKGGRAASHAAVARLPDSKRIFIEGRQVGGAWRHWDYSG